MAVHVFAVNMDSLSGSMAHNYYLYEYDGKLNMIPWDYNLSFGGMSMGGGSASEMINDAIDTPFSGTQFFDALLENDEYREKYHEYLEMLVTEYVNGGRFDETYQRIRSQIDELAKTDPTAFYSAEEYDVAADMIYDTVKLRAESIKGQLDGTIPSTDSGMKQDSSALIDASAIDIDAMGQFNMGSGFGRDDNTGGGSGRDDNMGGGFGRDDNMQPPDFGNSQPQEPDSMQPPDFDNSMKPSGSDNSMQPPGLDNSMKPPGSDNNMQPPEFDGNKMDFDADSFGMQSQNSSQGGIVALVCCFIAMIAALFGLKLYKRRR